MLSDSFREQKSNPPRIMLSVTANTPPKSAREPSVSEEPPRRKDTRGEIIGMLCFGVVNDEH